jgi:hypothetical protein
MEGHDIEQAISAAFDSVILINKLNSGDDPMSKLLGKERVEKTIESNIQHLKMMMEKTWFVESLSEAQKKQITKFTK